MKLPSNKSEVVPVQNGETASLKNRTAETMDADLPLTKVPLLDTVDQYVVSRSSEESTEAPSPIEIPCSIQQAGVVEKIFGGYARFIAAFTGLDELAFAFTLIGDNSASPESHGCVHAHLGPTKADQQSQLQDVNLVNLSGHAHEFDGEKIQFGIQVEVGPQDPSGLRLDKVCYSKSTLKKPFEKNVLTTNVAIYRENSTQR